MSRASDFSELFPTVEHVRFIGGVQVKHYYNLAVEEDSDSI
jgi:hypothetical protein